jgi:hypothetical protein
MVRGLRAGLRTDRSPAALLAGLPQTGFPGSARPRRRWRHDGGPGQARSRFARKDWREYTAYECRDCATRQLGVQRCADCGRFGRAAGFGGACPGCNEPVTLADLGLRPQTTHKAQQ